MCSYALMYSNSKRYKNEHYGKPPYVSVPLPYPQPLSCCVDVAKAIIFHCPLSEL